MKDLSVVILTVNQRDDTLRCLRALYSDPDTAGAEVVLVDNGSTDGTAEAVKPEFPHIIIVRNDKNRGVAAGRNAGVAACSGRKFTLFLDNDTIPEGSAVRALLHHLRTNPQCGIAAPSLLNRDGSPQPNAKDFPGIKEKIRNVCGMKTAYVMPEGDVVHPVYVMGACQMIRSELFHTVGTLDEHIFYGPEDADFCIRAAREGYTVDCLRRVTMIHDHRHITRRRINSTAIKHLLALARLWLKHRRC